MLPDLSFHLVGVSHHTANVEVRERLAFTPAEAAALLATEGPAGRPAVLLSTCNRTELYWSGDHDLEPWFRELALSRGAVLDGSLVRLDGTHAVRHLFAVTAGLDSQILGEAEILGQVRRACELARSAGTLGREIEHVFYAAVTAGRRVRRETRLGRHPASVSSAAVELGLSLTGTAAPRVLVLGAGEVANGALGALRELNVSDVKVASRNPNRAAAVARCWGAEARVWGELPGLLADTDLVVVATGAKRPCIAAGLLGAVVARRSRGELVVLDLAVPRNVEPSAREVAGVRLLDLDDLRDRCCPADPDTDPAEAVPEAERILLEELVRLDLTLRGRGAAPKLADLHRMAAELAQREAAWALSRLNGLSERERQIVRDMADRLVRRVLYPVSRSLRLDEATLESGKETGAESGEPLPVP